MSWLANLSWIQMALLFTVGLYAALRLFLALTIFVTSLTEVRIVCSLIPAERGDLAMPNPAIDSAEFNPYQETESPSDTYALSTNRRAGQLGFLPQGRHLQGQGGIYKGRYDIWLSPNGDTLALVQSGTVAGIKIDKTILYTAKADGRYIISSDRPTGVNAPGLFDNEIFWQMQLDWLVTGHQGRLRKLGGAIRPFPPNSGFASYREMRRRLVDHWIKGGEVAYRDPDQSSFRSTLKGACLAVFWSLKAPKIHRA